MTLPYPNSPDMDENIADSITRIEQNLEYLDSVLTTSTMKLINKSYDMSTTSGAVAITGVGFTPAAAIIYAIETTGGSFSWGSCDASDSMCTYWDYNDAANSSTTKAVLLSQAAGKQQEAVLTSYDSDGATFTWTKTGAPTGNMAIIFIFFA